MEIMMNDRERIGKKLAEIRNEKGYTVRQLAELADLRPATISNVETYLLKYAILWEQE